MHGVAHLFRADSYMRRAFWLLLTCMTSMAGCYHVYLTVHQFSLTPVSTLILNQGVDTVFPDVTLCNLRPMPQYLLHYDTQARRELESNIKILMDAVKKVYLDGRTRGGDLFGTQDYFHWYNLLQHYWASMNTAHLGHNLSLSLVACFYKKSLCNPDDFLLVQNSHYWNCWSFRPADRSVQGTGPNDGLSLILFTSTLPRDEASQTDLHVSFPPPKQRSTLEQLGTVFGKAGTQVSSGVRLLVHEPGTYPHVYWEGADVGNGWNADLRFKMTRNVYVNRTGHGCVENYGQTEYWTSEPSGRQKFRKRGMDCVVQKWQEHLMRECQCQSTYLPTKERSSLCHYLSPNSTINQNNGSSAVFGSWKSKQLKRFNDVEYQVRNKLYDAFASDCGNVQACEQSSYTYSVASVPWPTQTDLEAFIHTFVNRKFSRADYQGHRLLDQIVRFRKPPLDSKGSAISWNVSYRFVRQNFVKLQVFAEESKSTLIRESPSYSFVEVLSELGGIGGLWVGMSLVTFVELFEFFAILGVKCSQMVSSYFYDKRQNRKGGQSVNGSCRRGGNYLQVSSLQAPNTAVVREIGTYGSADTEAGGNESASLIDTETDTELAGVFVCEGLGSMWPPESAPRITRGQTMQHISVV